MNRLFFFSFAFSFAFSLLLPWCVIAQEPKNQTSPMEPGIVLTFDDSYNLDRWAKQIPLFEKYGAKATFFLDKPDKLTEHQKNCMKKLAAAGCEIACHGFRHRRANELIKEKGVDGFLDEEIRPAVKALEDLGYPQRSFAYPESRRDDETDKALKPFFKHVRSGGGASDKSPVDKNDNVFTPLDKASDKFLILGTRIDHFDKEKIVNNIRPGLERAKEKREILLFYAHGIAEQDGQGLHVLADTLEELLKQAKDLGLKFYTMGEL